MRDLVSYIKVAVLVLLVVISPLSLILGMATIDSSIPASIVLITIGLVTGLMANKMIYGK